MSALDLPNSRPDLMTRRLTLLFAVAGGAAVGNLYSSQPLLEFVARDFNASVATAGWLVTLTQIGYVLGILLVVPLGDVLNRKRIVPLILLTSAVALTACAIAPSIIVLQVALLAVGLTTVAGQLLVPLAGDLADPGRRVQVVGTMAAGMLTGILLSRTISGFIAGLLGWRAVYVVAAVAATVFAILLRRAIPQQEPKTSMPYPALLASLGALLVKHRTIRWTLLLGATAFAVFTMFWTSLTFLLSAPPFSYPVSIIGLFGLAGLAGIITAQRAGWLYDRGWGFPATGTAWALTLLTLISAALNAYSLVVILIAVVALDMAIQVIHRINQARLFEISHEARSRLNTLFITGNFIGGALGSAALAVLWPVGGWIAIMIATSGLCLFGLVVWFLGRKTLFHTTPALQLVG